MAGRGRRCNAEVMMLGIKQPMPAHDEWLGTDPFYAMIDHILEFEGKFVDDPDDPGGATNWGISVRFLRTTTEWRKYDVDGDGDLDAIDMRALTREQAVDIYRQIYTSMPWLSRLGMAAFPAFDHAINAGQRAAVKCVQRAIRAQCGVPLVDDGVIGPKTRSAIDVCSLQPGVLREARAGWYRVLVLNRPVFAKYERGWLRRAYFQLSYG